MKIWHQLVLKCKFSSLSSLTIRPASRTIITQLISLRSLEIYHRWTISCMFSIWLAWEGRNFRLIQLHLIEVASALLQSPSLSLWWKNWRTNRLKITPWTTSESTRWTATWTGTKLCSMGVTWCLRPQRSSQILMVQTFRTSHFTPLSSNNKRNFSTKQQPPLTTSRIDEVWLIHVVSLDAYRLLISHKNTSLNRNQIFYLFSEQ